MKPIIFAASVLLAGCAGNTSSNDKLVNDFMNEGMTASEAMKAYQNQYITNVVVSPPEQTNADDYSRWLKGQDLQKVADMVTCPPSKNTFSYRASAVAQHDGVHVTVNRANCQIDHEKAKEYLTEAIAENKSKAAARVHMEDERKQTSPVGPFVVGCQDYQRRFKGQKLLSASYALKQYSQINQVYVLNLYRMGFNVAQTHSPTADCEYLAAVSLNQ